MPDRYVVTISKTLHQKVGEESEHLDMHRKDYVQNALAFFANRKINPATYDPGKEFDLVQIVKHNTEHIASLIQEQQQVILVKMTEEIVRGRLLQEAQLNLMIEKLIEPELREQLQREIIEYVEKTLELSKNK